MTFPKRPDAGGRSGRATQVLVNMFPIKGLPKVDVYSYDVTIEEEGYTAPAAPLPGVKGVVLKNPTKPEVNRRILTRIVAQHGAKELQNIKLAYDGRSNLYTSRRLAQEEFNFVVGIEKIEGDSSSEQRKFNVNIKFTKQIDMTRLREFFEGRTPEIPQDCITALEIVMQHVPSSLFVTRSRSFFSPNNARPLGGGVEMWSGFFQSVRPAQSGLVLNIDVSATAFNEARPVIEIAGETWRKPPQMMVGFQPNDADRRTLERVLHLTQVETTHRADFKRRYRVKGICREPADREMFQCGDKQVSVAQYFKDTYQYTLKYPSLPCLRVGTKGTLIPIEVCTVVPGQHYARKLNDTQTASMIKFTCQKPQERQRKIEQGLKDLRVTETPQLQELGLAIDPRMMSVEGRVMDPPNVKYDGQPFTPRDGQWNMRDRRFVSGGILEYWGVLIVGPERFAPQMKVENFISGLLDMGRRTGLNVVHREPAYMRCERGGDDIASSLRALNDRVQQMFNGAMRFCICVVGGDTDTYARIKLITDVQMGLPSQCVRAVKIMNPNMQYFGNVLLKINTKIGGRNVQLANTPAILQQPTMVLGADVTHPGPLSGGSSTTPSIAAVVASMDQYVTQFTSSIRLQPPRCEEIQALKEMMVELLKTFREKLGVFPQRIIFFRDGVSEGQFMTVFNHEVNAIKNACMALFPDGSYNPPVSFIVIQKRHHVRMFPTSPRDADRSGNAQPGTVVDTSICHPHDFDFYLMSHSGIQGTSRPAHYYVLMDENGFTSDSMQQFCYHLCYLFSRCTRSVSIVPPAYYAHLLAYRARFHTAEDLWGSDTKSERTSRSGRSATTIGTSAGLERVHERLLKLRPMFFV